MDFVSDFVAFTKEFETPTSFWRWSGYALIAALLRDSVYFDHGYERKTYPNIYVLLLAESANNRKSGPFKPVRNLLNHSLLKNTKVISGRASIQAVIEDLASDTSEKGAGATPIRGGSCICLSEEFSGFFVKDPSLIAIVTDMYEFYEQYHYRIKSYGGKITIKNLCFSMLAASNEDLLYDVFDSRAIKGGLLGRTFIIRPDEVRPPNSQLEVSLENYNNADLVKQLQQIKNTVKGRFTASKDAAAFYDSWYKKLYALYPKLSDKTGVIQRMHTGALKLAMIIAASQCSLTIELQHMEDAIHQVIALKSNYDSFSMRTGKGDHAEIGAAILTDMRARGGKITRKELLFLHFSEITAEDLNKVIETFEQSDLIQTTSIGSEIAYVMTKRCKAMFDKPELNNGTGGSKAAGV